MRRRWAAPQTTGADNHLCCCWRAAGPPPAATAALAPLLLGAAHLRVLSTWPLGRALSTLSHSRVRTGSWTPAPKSGGIGQPWRAAPANTSGAGGQHRRIGVKEVGRSLQHCLARQTGQQELENLLNIGPARNPEKAGCKEVRAGGPACTQGCGRSREGRERGILFLCVYQIRHAGLDGGCLAVRASKQVAHVGLAVVRCSIWGPEGRPLSPPEGQAPRRTAGC